MPDCEVVWGRECEAPPGSEHPRLRTACYACGSPVCVECSAIIPYHHRRRRICASCADMLGLSLVTEYRLALADSTAASEWTTDSREEAINRLLDESAWQREGRLWGYLGVDKLPVKVQLQSRKPGGIWVVEPLAPEDKR